MKKGLIVMLMVGGVLFALYGYLQPQSLKRDIASELELMPTSNLKSVTVFPNFNETLDKAKGKAWFQKAESNGLMDDLYDYLAFRFGIEGLPAKAIKLLNGKPFWGLLGNGFAVAKYDGGEGIFISHPAKYVLMSWREIVRDAQSYTHSGYTYFRLSDRSYITFLGDFFVATNSEPLMWAVLERASEPMESAADSLPNWSGIHPYAYGWMWMDGQIMVGKLDFVVKSDGIELVLPSPDGVLGRPLSKAKPAGKMVVDDGMTAKVEFAKFDFSNAEDFLDETYQDYTNAMTKDGIMPIFPMLNGRLVLVLDGFTRDYYSVPGFAASVQVARKYRKDIGNAVRQHLSPDQNLVDWSVESGRLYFWNRIGLKQKITEKTGRKIKKKGLFLYLNSDRLVSQMGDYFVHVSKYSEHVDDVAVRNKLIDVLKLMGGGDFYGTMKKDGDIIRIFITH